MCIHTAKQSHGIEIMKNSFESIFKIVLTGNDAMI